MNCTGVLLVIDDLGQTVEVGKQQMGALVGGEPAGETDYEGVGVDLVEHLHNLAGITLILEPFFP